MEYKEKRKALMLEAENLIREKKIEEAKAKMDEVKALDAEHEEEVRAQADFEALNRNVIAQRTPEVSLAAGEITGTQGRKVEDVFSTKEYENAFKDYVQKGTPIPDRFKNTAAKSTTADLSAVIPTTLAREIIKEMKSYGNLYAKVRKTNVPGGVEYPILTLKPTATWVGEGASDDQKVQANTKVSFSYYGLECKIAETLLASIVMLDEFNDEFVRLAVEAIVAALDKAIVNGTGSGQPLGVTVDTRVPAANKLTLNENEITSWATWKKKVFAKMKKAYRNGCFIMAQATFDSYIDGMVDTTGQPIGRVNYGIDGGEKYRFGGKEVEIVEDDIIKDFDTASKNDTVAVFVDLKDYAINSNMEMTTTKWTDHDTNQVKQKVMVIVDGKLLDPNGVLIIKKGEVSTQSQTPAGGDS